MVFWIVFRFRGKQQPERPRTAAINRDPVPTTLEDLGEEMIKDLLAGGNGAGVNAGNTNGDQEFRENFNDFFSEKMD